MKVLLDYKIRETLMIVGGFCLWTVLNRSFEYWTDGSLGFSYLFATIIYFVIAFFIPERPRGAFVSRSSVIGIATLFLWLGVTDLTFMGENGVQSYVESMVPELILWLILLAMLFAFYWGSIYLIRGFYSDPLYQNEAVEDKE